MRRHEIKLDGRCQGSQFVFVAPGASLGVERKDLKGSGEREVERKMMI